ncbi:hypothetical protein [Nocardia sp. NBC_01388]|uniref:hypothetical protein n=1 Tax=Nocardia sp. NBC_01388 TaxID=2903596 RepID=UPI00325247A9
MTAAWLPFLIGMTTGSVLVWFLSAIPSHSRTPSAESWTVAAIASRIERERSDRRREGFRTCTAAPTRHRQAHTSRE